MDQLSLLPGGSKTKLRQAIPLTSQEGLICLNDKMIDIRKCGIHYIISFGVTIFPYFLEFLIKGGYRDVNSHGRRGGVIGDASCAPSRLGCL